VKGWPLAHPPRAGVDDRDETPDINLPSEVELPFAGAGAVNYRVIPPQNC